MDSMPPRQAAPLERDEDDLDLGEILLTLWLGKFWILLFLLLGLLGGVFHVLNSPASYQADSLIQIEQRGSGMAMALPEALRRATDSDTRTVTEIEIIRSRLVLGQASADVNFDWQTAPVNMPWVGQALVALAPYSSRLATALNLLPGAERLELELLQVPPEWLGRPITLIVGEEDGRFALLLPDGRELRGQVGEMLRLPDSSFALKLAQLSARPERRFQIWQRGELASINAMRGGLTITEEGRSSGVLRLRYIAASPAEAERVLAAITQAFVRQNIGRSAAEAESGLRFIRAQLPETQARLQAAEEALNRYRRQQQSVDLSFETQALLTQIRAVEAELAGLQAREDEIKARYTPSHPIYQQLLTQRRRLRDRLEGLQREVGALPSTQREMANLTREVEIAQATYTQLLTRAQELGVMSASSVGNVRLLDAARASAAPVAPRSARIVAIAALIGLLLGCAFVWLRNWLRTGIQSAPQLEEIGLPVFGIVGFSPKAQRAKARRDYRILAQAEPTDLAIEAFRSLRTSLHFGLAQGGNRAVAITSTHPGAGKSFVSLNLAYVAAEAGLRVCLIDADLRRGTLRRYFGLSAEQPGLSEFLAGSVPLGAVRRATGVPGLEVITTGRYPPNPSELLMRPALAEGLRELAKDHDLILIDTPPALMLTDATLIAGVSDAVLFVARHGLTRSVELEDAKRHFEQAGIRVTGSVLNAFNPKQTGSRHYYRYKYYSYGYKSRYKPDGKA